MWALNISRAVIGILISGGGNQLLKLWIISRFFLLGYTRSGDHAVISRRGVRAAAVSRFGEAKW